MEQETKHKDHDRLVQRMITLQSVLSQLGFDEDFDEEDIKRELSRLPKDSEDFLDFSRAQKKQEEAPKGEEESKFEIDFTPFNPNEAGEEEVQKTLEETLPAQPSTPRLNPLGRPITPPALPVAQPKEGPGTW